MNHENSPNAAAASNSRSLSRVSRHLENRKRAQPEHRKAIPKHEKNLLLNLRLLNKNARNEDEFFLEELLSEVAVKSLHIGVRLRGAASEQKDSRAPSSSGGWLAEGGGEAKILYSNGSFLSRNNTIHLLNAS